jgi:hypothetical protein
MDEQRLIQLIIVFSVLITISLLIWSTNRDRKKRWAKIDPEKARKMYYHGSDITPTKGDFFIRVSEWQWVNVFWDKSKKELIIKRPPSTMWHDKNHPIYIEETNWRIVAERQPVRVSVDDYFVRQVM